MPTFNQGIRTKAGDDLFGRVDSGQTKITYTKVVFSSLDLSSNSDEEIENMTDIQPQELATKPEVLNKSFKNTGNGPETEIRAIVSNESLSKGMFINTYGLYASDDQGHNILYGVSVDDHPSYLPAFAPNERPQQITYNWDTAISDTNDINFTDTNDAYATYDDLKDYETSASADDAHTSLANGVASNSALISNANTSLSSLISNGTNQSEINDLQQQITSNKNNISSNSNDISHFTMAHIVYPSDINNDINNLTTTGIYSVWGRDHQIPNSPADALNYIIIVLQNSEACYQIALEDGTLEKFIRFHYGKGSWTAWKNIADDLQNKIDQANQNATNVLNQANANMETNRSNLQNQLNNLPKDTNTLINKGKIPHNDLNQDTDAGMYDLYGENLINNPGFGSSNNNYYGKLYVFKDLNNTTYQILISIGSNNNRNDRGSNHDIAIAYRGIGYSWHILADEQQLDNKIQITSNEQDAKNKSNNNPNTLFVYSD